MYYLLHSILTKTLRYLIDINKLSQLSPPDHSVVFRIYKDVLFKGVFS